MSDPHPESDRQLADDAAPGWAAIDARLTDLYSDQEPTHWATIVKHAVGGNDPLDGVSAYRRDEPTPHWHYVTYGCSELYEKVSDDPECSGWGFEISFRLARDAGDADPPTWPISTFQSLARYVFKSGNVFRPGDHINLNKPIVSEQSNTTRITALGVVADSEFPEIESENGKLTMLQLFGLTADELAAKISWNGGDFCRLVAEHYPLHVTDVRRESLLNDESFAQRVEQGRGAGGSSTGVTYADSIRWSRAEDRLFLELAASTVAEFRQILPGRIPFDRPYILYSFDSKQTIRFDPGEAASWRQGDEAGEICVTLPADLVGSWSALGEIGEHAMAGFDDVVMRIVSG
ncbi:MAG: suppressor of fused domain protein [Pirellulaceae bacterium]|jgi:hypothetical protein|nr:suppressor of fused domain protein [Pirellulaceae bacterium]MDP7019693.1 suppressor of fused domain protein [Pirellulaceae bacterium]